MQQIEGRGKNRLEYLNALRGLAAMWVLIEHTALSPQPRLHVPGWLETFVVSGSMGVELFFVVSAFSLCLSMPAHANEKRPLVGFALRRFFRITPLFYAVMLLALWWYPQRSWGEIAANVFFVFNFFEKFQPSIVWSGWTIGIEMPFYFLFPLIYNYVRNIWHAVAAILLFIFIGDVFRGGVTMFASDPPTYLLYATVNKLPIFGFGLLAFYAVPILKDHPRAKEIGTICLLGSLVVFTMIHTGATALIYSWYWRGPLFFLVVLGFALNPLPLLVNYYTDWLGERSYSIYLTHIPVMIMLWPTMRWLETHISPAWSFLVIAMMMTTATLAASVISYSFFERPINDFGRRFAKRIAGASSTSNISAGQPNTP